MKIDENGIKINSWAEILERRTSALREIYGDDIDLSQNTPDGQRVGIEARMEVDLQQLGAYIYNEMDPDLASMNGLRILGKLTDVQARQATHSAWDIKITTDRNMSIRDGFAIRDNVDQKWTAKAQDLKAGDNTITFTAIEEGSISGGTSVRLDTVLLGITKVEPVGSIRVGRDGETPAEFKIRRRNTIAIASQSIIGGLVSGLYNINDVTDVAIYENENSEKDPLTQLPPNSLYAVVEGGDISDIAEVIAKHKTIGARTVGETSGAYNERLETSKGVFWFDHKMNFDRPTYVDVYVKLNATRQDADEPIDYEAIQSQIGSVRKKIGEDLQAGELYKHSYTTVSKYIVTDLEISRSKSSGYTDTFLQPAINERLILKPENVDVTVI